jgi:uncharacterized membrane protein YfcA
MSLIPWPFLLGLGTVASIMGALAGLAGAFLTLPVLRFLGVEPRVAAAASLSMALANAASASFAYWRQGRLDWKIAGLIAITGVPAGIAGALAVQHVKAASFDLLLAGMQVLIIISLLRRRPAPAEVDDPRANRVLTDAFGIEHRYRIEPALLLGIGVVVGFISSFFGIGGGIVMVPVMILLLRVPPHIATATSSFAILLTSPAGVLTHFFLERADPSKLIYYATFLAIGGLAGGQIGARLAPYVSARALQILLAVLLAAAAASLVARHL